jgi:tRNA A37 methylthiotransferase MiaB
MTGTRGVAAYFDLSFQHASEPLLRRMRRFGGTERFLELLASIRSRISNAGVRSNVIVGFPGETAADFAELERFLSEARLDAIGVFGYSDEDGTEAAGLADKIPPEIVAERVERIASLTEELVAQRAEDRIGESVEVLIESIDGEVAEGSAEHQAPEVDGSVSVSAATGAGLGGLAIGDVVPATVIQAVGVDLVAVTG